MRAFITGITGFAGTHLAEHLLRCGDRVMGCSSAGRWRPRTPGQLIQQVPLVAWDLSAASTGQAAEHLHQFDPEIVYHLAALAVPGDCGAQEPTSQAWNVNVVGTRRLLDQLSRLNHRPRVLLVSSCHVYAPVSPESSVVSEDAPLEPATAYGKTKLAAEGAVSSACKSGFDAVIARTFKHAGPRQDARLMLSEWAVQLLAASEAPVEVVNLDSHFDMTDVRDIVRVYRLLARQGRCGSAYNVGSGIALRSGDVFQRLRQIAGCNRPVIELSPGRRQEPIADITRLRQCTGWQPEVTLDTTLQDTLDYWRTQL